MAILYVGNGLAKTCCGPWSGRARQACAVRPSVARHAARAHRIAGAVHRDHGRFTAKPCCGQPCALCEVSGSTFWACLVAATAEALRNEGEDEGIE